MSSISGYGQSSINYYSSNTQASSTAQSAQTNFASALMQGMNQSSDASSGASGWSGSSGSMQAQLTQMLMNAQSSQLGGSQGGQNGQSGFKQDMSALASALGSGDISGAQKAIADIQALHSARQSQNAVSSTASATQTSATSTKDKIGQDFTAIQTALSSNDLTEAQSAFAKLQTDMKSSSGGHHHHHADQSSSASSSSTQSLLDMLSQNSAAQPFASSATPASSNSSGSNSNSSNTQNLLNTLLQSIASKYSSGSTSSNLSFSA